MHETIGAMRLRVLICGVALLATAGCGGGGDAVDPLPTPSGHPEVSPDDGNAGADGSGGGDGAGQAAGPVQLRVVAETDPALAPVKCAVDPVPSVATPPDEEVVVCDRLGLAYVLGPAVSVGGVESATAELPEGGDWSVLIEFDEQTADALADVTADLAESGRQLAIVHGGMVITAPSVQGAITGGRVQIAGTFSESEAEALAAAMEAEG